MSNDEIVDAFKKLVSRNSITPYRVVKSYMEDSWEVVNPLVSHSAGCPYKVLGLINKGYAHEFVAFPISGNVGLCNSFDAAVSWILSCYPVPVEV